MEVRVKLMGMLRDRSPAGGVVQLPEGATVADLLQQLEIPAREVMLVTVNGQHQRDHSVRLSPGDEVTVLPPVGGG